MSGSGKACAMESAKLILLSSKDAMDDMLAE
jgi:hypothetical protein